MYTQLFDITVTKNNEIYLIGWFFTTSLFVVVRSKILLVLYVFCFDICLSHVNLSLSLMMLHYIARILRSFFACSHILEVYKFETWRKYYLTIELSLLKDGLSDMFDSVVLWFVNKTISQMCCNASNRVASFMPRDIDF